MIGRTLGHYEIIEKIGEGGMSEVYRARDLVLGRDVALKVLPGDMATNPRQRARFEREAKAVAALSHSNILEIFDFDTRDGVTFAVTELLEGEYTGDDMTIAFNTRYLTNGLNAVNDEKVVIETSDPLKPGLLLGQQF